MRPKKFMALILSLTLAVALSASTGPHRAARLGHQAVGFAASSTPTGVSVPQAHHDVAVTGVAVPGALITASDTITVTNVGQLLSNSAPPGPGSVYGRIRGNVAFVRRIRAALDWMQAHDLEAYQRVETYVTAITPSPYARLAQAQPRPDGSCLVQALAHRRMPMEMTAALLYHEASHCYQFATAGVLTNKEAEVFAYTEQIAFMERHGFPAEEIEYYRQVLAYYASQPDDGRYIPPPEF